MKKMFTLRCTVRRCQNRLELRKDGLFCAAGHHFDLSKEGYWNLTQPQHKKSLNPGDTDDAVMARHRWLERGHASGLIETLNQWIASESVSVEPLILDLGCGEGTFGPALFPNDATNYCGIDLSRRAIKIAARRWPETTWVLANADRKLPALDQSVGRVVSLFGRRPVEEIKRVLAPGGYCIVAVPGALDLIELREKVQSHGQRRSRWEGVVDEMSHHGLTCTVRQRWSKQIEASPSEIADALAMTYRAVRKSQHEQLQNVGKMQVTLDADLLLFRANEPHHA